MYLLGRFQKGYPLLSPSLSLPPESTPVCKSTDVCPPRLAPHGWVPAVNCTATELRPTLSEEIEGKHYSCDCGGDKLTDMLCRFQPETRFLFTYKRAGNTSVQVRQGMGVSTSSIFFIYILVFPPISVRICADRVTFHAQRGARNTLLAGALGGPLGTAVNIDGVLAICVSGSMYIHICCSWLAHIYTRDMHTPGPISSCSGRYGVRAMGGTAAATLPE